MPVHFVLKRFMPEFEEQGEAIDLYEAIKTGKKKVEYRDASEYWAKRLFSDRGMLVYTTIRRLVGSDPRKVLIMGFGFDPSCDAEWGTQITFSAADLKHSEANFRVGYTKKPTLHADIKKVVWNLEYDWFEIELENVIEIE